MLTMFSQEGHFCHATIQAFQKKKKKKPNITTFRRQPTLQKWNSVPWGYSDFGVRHDSSAAKGSLVLVPVKQ